MGHDPKSNEAELSSGMGVEDMGSEHGLMAELCSGAVEEEEAMGSEHGMDR